MTSSGRPRMSANEPVWLGSCPNEPESQINPLGRWT